MATRKRVATLVIAKSSVAPKAIREWETAMISAGFIPTVIEYDTKLGYQPVFITTP